MDRRYSCRGAAGPELRCCEAALEEQRLVMPPGSRHFVGFDRPFLHSLCDFLLAGSGAGAGLAGAMDLSRTIVVLPGARAGRRLLELLVDRSMGMGRGGGAGGAVIPPRILTVGVFVAEMAASSGRAAVELERQLAWAMALRESDGSLRSVIARGPEDGDIVGWLEVGGLLDRCHGELAGEGLSFADVLRRTPWGGASDFDDGERWAGLAEVERGYRAQLAVAGLEDPDRARFAAVRTPGAVAGALPPDVRVVIAGATDLSGVARLVIDAIGDDCTVVVFAPNSMADRFDEYGCVVPAKWENVPIDLPGERVFFVDKPADQAAAALGALAELPRDVPPDGVTIGVPDDEVTGHIERLAGRMGGVAVHRASGVAGGVAASAPYRLLAAAADFLDRRHLRDFATLVRHPDVERWLRRSWAREAGKKRGAAEEWLGLLDEYQAEHLHVALPERWLSEEETSRRLEWLSDRVTELLRDLDPGEARRDRPLSAWAEPMWSLLHRVYGRAETTRGTAGLIAGEACLIIREALASLRELHESLGGHPRSVSAAAAIRAVLSLVRSEPITDEVGGGGGAAIELLGWLELALDDAEVLVITGLNEGRVPRAVATDAFLPDSVRSRLGLADDGRRLARDAHALTAMAASRPDLTIIAGHRSDRNDPLVPSRLLLACEGEELLRRVRLWSGTDSEPAHVPRIRIGHTGVSRFAAHPPVVSTPCPLTSMSVTSFKDYLKSPYVFYLKHVRRLEEVDDGGPELNPLSFGHLLHDVLEKLAGTDWARSDDPDKVAAFLCSQLEAVALLRLGDEPAPAVWVQLEQAKDRLRAFARCQAAWFAQGWRIRHAEWMPAKGGAPWIVKGEAMRLRGRIDRIDYNEREKAWAILDYKTGERAPKLAEYQRRDGAWQDLQLPLYRYVASPLELEGDIRLGLIVLPSKPDEVGFNLAEWTPDVLRSADDAARSVIEGVRAGKFDELGPFPASMGTLGAICGEGLIISGDEGGEGAP